MPGWVYSEGKASAKLKFLSKEDYKGSRVLILGGGDGALLKELLDLPSPPSHVTMIELDEAVMVGCSSYMGNICGQNLDPEHRVGTGHKVICGDAIQFMEEAKTRGENYFRILHEISIVLC